MNLVDTLPTILILLLNSEQFDYFQYYVLLSSSNKSGYILANKEGGSAWKT